MADRYTCPACGYPCLTRPPRSQSGGGSYEICLSCGFEYGVTDDDEGYSYSTWRAKWVGNGMPWQSVGHEAPPNWNPQQQLDNLLGKGTSSSG